MQLQISSHEIDRLLVTANSEYQMCGNLCVRVRDLATGECCPSHDALGQELMGSFAVTRNGTWSVEFGNVEIGHRLYFASDTLTSPLCRVVHALPMTAQAALPLAA